MHESPYAVIGTLRLCQRGDITLEQAEEIVNMWIELSARKGYSEGVIDGLRKNKVTQKTLDMGM